MVDPDRAAAGETGTDGSQPQKRDSTFGGRAAGRVGRNTETAEKRSRLLSGLLAINILFLGAALVLSSIFNRSSVPGSRTLVLLMVLAALAVGWMLCHQSVSPAVPHRDPHAGAIWLRGAVLLFGLCTVLLDAFKVGYYLQQRDGARTVRVVYPIVEAVFVSIQTNLLWFHSRDCVHVRRDATRCGLMVTLATDLVVWITMVSDDSIHMEFEAVEQAAHNRSSSQLTGGGNGSEPGCRSELCAVLRKAIVIMYPFNIEYCLIASTMLYILWSNVGRVIGHHGPHPSGRFQGRGLVVGPLLGALVMGTGLVIFVLYQLGVSAQPRAPTPFIQFYTFHIALLSLMSLCSLAALAVHRWEVREPDSRENPSRSLDVVLLQVAALGPLGVSYFSMVAVASTHPRRPADLLNLAYSLLTITQHVLQNLFIIEGLHRQCLPQDTGPRSAAPSDSDPTIDLRDLAEQPAPRPQPPVRGPPAASPDPGKLAALPRAAAGPLNWKRKFLKEISMFMIMSNLILWIMPAFGAQPQFENGLEKQFYGFSVWFAILNFGLPLGVFYRMHSAGNLLEIYLSA